MGWGGEVGGRLYVFLYFICFLREPPGSRACDKESCNDGDANYRWHDGCPGHIANEDSSCECRGDRDIGTHHLVEVFVDPDFAQPRYGQKVAEQIVTADQEEPAKN